MVDYYYRPKGTLIIYDSTPAMNIEDSRKLVSKQDAAEKIWAINNLPSEYHPSVFDRGPYLRDETWMQFVRWKMVGEKDQTVEYVEPVESLIYVMPTEGRSVFYNKGGLRMAEAEGIINFRDVGVHLSKAHDLMKHIEDFMTSAEGYEFAIEHSELLSKAPSIDWIVIDKIPDAPNAIYGVAQVSEDSALLFGNVDSYKVIDRWAEREGIDTNDFIRRAIGEEYAHLIRRGVAGVPEEEAVRVWLIDMYTKLAERAPDFETKGKYQRMISALEKDLATVRQRYSRPYRNLEGFVKMYISDSSKLELILEAEARLEYGLTDDKEVKEYVASRLEEIAKIAENGDENYEAVGLDGEMAEYAGDVTERGDVKGGEGSEACAAEDGGESGEGGDSGGE